MYFLPSLAVTPFIFLYVCVKKNLYHPTMHPDIDLYHPKIHPDLFTNNYTFHSHIIIITPLTILWNQFVLCHRRGTNRVHWCLTKKSWHHKTEKSYVIKKWRQPGSDEDRMLRQDAVHGENIFFITLELGKDAQIPLLMYVLLQSPWVSHLDRTYNGKSHACEDIKLGKKI